MVYKRTLAIGVISLSLILSGCSMNKAVNVKSTDSGLNIYSTSNTIEKTKYINETVCTNTSLDEELFEISFQTNEDAQYISNKELLDLMAESEETENIQNYLDTAQKAVLLTFAQDGNKLEQKPYCSSMANLYAASNAIYINGNTYGPEEYATYLYELYTKNKIHVNGEFITDKSLIWQNNYMYYVRGTLNLTLEEDAGEVYNKEFHLPLKETSENIKLIVQVKFMSGNCNQIIGIDILGMI